MVQTPTKPVTISIELPTAIALQVTPEQFAAIAIANRDLKEDVLSKFVLNLTRV